jgi:DHA1 family bicyclomycin/chloramphenicol resistance-like MFS transporter
VKINIRLVKFRSPLKLLKFGILTQLIFAIALFLVHETTNVYLFAVTLALYVSMQGFIFGNAVSVILDKFSHISATANAVIGSLQYGAGSLSGFIVSYFNDGTLLPFVSVLMFSSFIGTIVMFFSLKLKD